MSGGSVLDTGALIALEHNDRRMIAFLVRAQQQAARLVVPSGVLAQTWRGGPRQARLAAFLKSADVYVAPLGEWDARRIGQILGARGTSDVVDASIVLAAHDFGDEDGPLTVMTSDPDDIAHLDGGLHITPI